MIAVDVLARMFGPGFAGVEPIFALLIMQGFVFRASFGFALGTLSLLTSALITAGIGPWLPFQMFAAGLVAGGAGLLPRLRSGNFERVILSLYGIVGAYLYGAIVTLWQWPLLAGSNSGLSYLPTGTLVENFFRFVQYSIVSGGILWDSGRAITTVVIVVVFGKTIMAALNRAAHRLELKPMRSAQSQLHRR